MRRRRVLYDATSRAAADAAELLRGEFDVAGLSVAADPTADGPVVVLVGRDATDPRRGEAPLRVVALVGRDGAGPWPAHWYAVLPEGVSAAMLARTIDNAFADLDRAAETARLDREMTRLDRELSELNAIGIRLSAERNPRDLIETILTKAREITHSDAGSLYLVEEAPDGRRDRGHGATLHRAPRTAPGLTRLAGGGGQSEPPPLREHSRALRRLREGIGHRDRVARPHDFRPFGPRRQPHGGSRRGDRPL